MIDLNDAVRDIINTEINQIMNPYRDVLDRMHKLTTPMSIKPATMPASQSKAPPKSKACLPKKIAAPVPIMSDLVVGALVRYRQGRGEFDAKIVAVDPVGHQVDIARVADGKRLVRPVTKIYAASPTAPAQIAP